MGFWGGASSSQKRAFEGASRTGQQRMGNVYDRAMDSADWYGGRSRQQLTQQDERTGHLWGQLWDEGGVFNPATGGGGGGGGGGPRFDNTLWKQLRDTGDLTPGDWANARETYNDFRTTGGISDDMRTALRQRALAGTEIYDPSADARSRVQGGWGAPTSGSDLARQKAIAELRNRAAWGAESDLLGQELEGKKWGATSLEGLGGRVQAGRIQGQQQLDQQARQQAAARRAAAARAQASRDAQWSRSMQLIGMGYGNAGQTGADLPYLQAAGGAAQGGYGMAGDTFGRQQQNKGWGSQLFSMAGQAAGAMAGLPTWAGGNPPK